MRHTLSPVSFLRAARGNEGEFSVAVIIVLLSFLFLRRLFPGDHVGGGVGDDTGAVADHAADRSRRHVRLPEEVDVHVLGRLSRGLGVGTNSVVNALKFGFEFVDGEVLWGTDGC